MLGRCIQASRSINQCRSYASIVRAKHKGKVPLLLSLSWDGSTDPTGWWVSEKLDGVRGYWDGSMMWSKQGKQHIAPEVFTRDLPNIALDGEIWWARGKFQETNGIILRSKDETKWSNLKYYIFDVPSHPDLPFEKRMEIVDEIIAKSKSPFLAKVDMVKCEGPDHLQKMLDDVTKLGGEGLMIRQPGSLYIQGRSESLQKVKAFEDMEVKFVSRHPTPGYHSYLCETPWGKQLNVNCTYSDWKHTPAEGSVISVRYSGTWKSGLPKYPFYYRPRDDLNWEDVVKEHYEKQLKQQQQQ
eukprot:TRINITY_DN3614_c0_g1_i2.p1 TRINITY_DN3614_c0_g1~~TRINITY_DN3614_c0_g1_i2.p1  ORF type:complete len:298 (-),score=63.74 TRINITY_DN3614_c0_g1_i2:103-996(-)